jgi:HAD superfamily hydrolase (TIGR01509 family)
MSPDNRRDESPSEEMIDRTLADSFPASDPPSWTLGRDHDQELERGDAESAGAAPTAADKESGASQAAGLKERLRARAFLFDLDGTLVDSVYQHVLSWHEALAASGFELAVWRIHRRIGMSGGLLVNALLRETGRRVTPEEAAHLQRLHTEAYARRVDQIRPLPGAKELLAYLSQTGVPCAIATSGRQESACLTVDILGLGSGVPLITRDQVDHAKPDPDLFLAAAKRLGVDINESVVVGDSVWDLLAARRARTLGVGLLSGGYGQDELERAGAYRVYEDPADLLKHLDEVGVRPAG